MTTAYRKLQEELRTSTRRWLVTGASGFIGSHLVETLLRLNQSVVGLDNFVTSSIDNLNQVQKLVDGSSWSRFKFIEGDIRDLKTCHEAVKGADYVLHQAALASVPRSISDPISTTQVNVDGFINVLIAARDASVKRTVYASSSSVYGDSPTLPKKEDEIGKPLSPYALSKYSDELYADVFRRCYAIETIGLRYFNVFGPRQDPEGPYAAVLPRWTKALMVGNTPTLYGDGSTSRDFCFVDNAVQANLLAATCENPEAVGSVFNVAVSDQTSLNDLYILLSKRMAEKLGQKLPDAPIREPFRAGDIKHSLASIERAQKLLGYAPEVKLPDGLTRWVNWVVESPKWNS